MDSIRREIIGPVKDDLRRSGKIAKLSFWIGLVGGILAIISLTLNIYTLIYPPKSNGIASSISKTLSNDK
jgi:hypothetical protein